MQNASVYLYAVSDSTSNDSLYNRFYVDYNSSPYERKQLAWVYDFSLCENYWEHVNDWNL